jgi:hypothetical protein
MKRHLAIYVEEHEFAQLKEDAKRRRISLSRCVYARLVQDRASADAEISALPARAVAMGTADTAAMRAALTETIKPLSQQIGILTAMLDQFVLAMLINTPEIAEGKKEQAIGAGERRYRGWERAVQELVERMTSEVRGEHDAAASNGAHA